MILKKNDSFCFIWSFFTRYVILNDVTSRELSEILHLSVTGINMLVSKINAEIGNYAEIINTMSNLSIYYKRENNLTTLVHIICRNSNVLLCMKFYITNKNNRSFSDFYDQYFLSPANELHYRSGKKFEDLIKYHTKENGNKKIISITVEKGKREIQAIDVLFLNMKKLFSMISLIQ